MSRYKITVPNGADGLPAQPFIRPRKSLSAALGKAKKLASGVYMVAKVQDVRTHKAWVADRFGVRRVVADFDVNTGQ